MTRQEMIEVIRYERCKNGETLFIKPYNYGFAPDRYIPIPLDGLEEQSDACIQFIYERVK